ncbi:MAG TPA: MASE1 domain-containing protein [Usitatibacter sp.]|nr:MASE1 domain-containing protein [Usitatibacter sp.]
MERIADPLGEEALGKPDDRRIIALAVFACVAYYLGARLGFALTFQPNPISTLWPPNAVLLAALLLAPARRWPLLVLATFPAHVAAQLESHIPLVMMLGWFATNCSEALIGAFLVRQLLGDELRFDSVRHTLVFIAYAGLVAPFLSSFLDATFVTLNGWGGASYWQVWTKRMFSNVLSELAIAPVIVTWLAGAPSDRRSPPWSAAAEATLLVVCLVLANFTAFWLQDRSSGAPAMLRYLPVPFLLWAALRFGPRGASAAFLSVVLAAIWGALHDKGPFLSEDAADTARSLQVFLSVMAMAVLLLAAAIGEREHARRELTHLSRVALVGKLTGAIAHELRQPLGAILSNAQATRRVLSHDTFDRQELIDSLEDIVEQDLRAVRVLRGLRSLIAKEEPTRLPVDLKAVVTEAVELMAVQLKLRGVRVETQLESTLPMVTGDPVQLVQVVLNLLANASEEMAEAAPAERAIAISSDVSPDRVALRFEDRGRGFAADDTEKLFEAFYSTKKSGLGLGLWICRAIIAAHGGRIWAESRGHGAVFHIELPAARAG